MSGYKLIDVRSGLYKMAESMDDDLVKDHSRFWLNDNLPDRDEDEFLTADEINDIVGRFVKVMIDLAEASKG